MATSRISQSPYLRIIASVFATIFLGFGIHFTLTPSAAVQFFEFDAPTSASANKLVESFVVLYAVRDVFMALAIYAAAYFGERRTLGWILVAGGAVAGMDGVVAKNQIGRGQWNHWGYAPMLVVVGVMLLGVLDGS